MLPSLIDNRKVYIEISNLIHGGMGWELGTCLWSPVFASVRTTKAWQMMAKAKPGDIVLHLIDIKGIYHWFGVSQCASTLITINEEPINAGKWANVVLQSIMDKSLAS